MEETPPSIEMPRLGRPQPEQQADQFRCDVLLFVATSTEKETLKSVANRMGYSFTRINRSFRYYDLGRIGSYQRVMAVKSEMGPFSNDGSAARALVAVAETRATAIVSLGMAFGISRSRQRHGHVLVSEALFTYDNRLVFTTKRGRSKSDYSDLEPYPANPALLSTFRRISRQDEWKDIVHFGPMLTGGARIHCRLFRDDLAKAISRENNPIIGGEMEGIGLLSASPTDNPTWVVVKGVSDFADGRRDDEVETYRPLACENAARFVLTALRDFNPETEN